MLLDKIKLEPGEEILIQTRRHWFIITAEVAAALLVSVVPLILLLFLTKFTAGDHQLGFYVSSYWAEFVFLYLFFLLMIWITIFNLLTNYYLDVVTITNRRAVLVDQKGFFRRNVASFRLERMQDMNVEVDGFLATMLDYGTVEVETASDSEQEFRATFIPQPNHLKSIILQAADNLISTTPKHDGLEEIDRASVANNNLKA